MNYFLIVFSFLPLLLNAQDKIGIEFDEKSSWDHIKEEAKRNKKFIFLDCYTTWCGPCKAMDRDIYSSPKVGYYMNNNFISVKVQMDHTKWDSKRIKRWYVEARDIMNENEVKVFPTYLIFSPKGKMIYRDQGIKNIDDFLAIGSNALRYYVKLNKYLLGEKDYDTMPYIALTAKRIGELKIANKVAREYINGYLFNLNKSKLYTKENIEFVANFVNSKDNSINLFYCYPYLVDEAMKIRGYSQNVMDYVITKEEIESKLWHGKEKIKSPQWNNLISIISKKYNIDYAERTVLNAQIKWYEINKNWPEIVKYNVKKIENYGLDTTAMGRFFVNNIIWEVIFLHSNDRKTLDKGIRWMEILLEADSNRQNHIDTYANLLYKIGKVKDAILWEEKAIKIEEDNAAKLNIVPDKIYRETLEKMLRGEPTWIQVN